MFIPRYSPIPRQPLMHQAGLPSTFTLGVWNIHKEIKPFVHQAPMETFLGRQAPHILALQEAPHDCEQSLYFGVPFAMAANIQTKRQLFGVITASPYAFKTQQHCLTQTRELGWVTHKTALITKHFCDNGQSLVLVNLHAINFVSNKKFYQEMTHLATTLAGYSGPLILSGDFNTRNRYRLALVQEITQQLHLNPIEFNNSQHIKTLLRQRLDHIFYRDLICDHAEAVKVPKISDHNPLFAQFSLKPLKE